MEINKNFYKRINRFAAKHQFNIRPIYASGVSFCAADIDEYRKMQSLIFRLQNITMQSNINTLSIHVFDSDIFAEYKKSKEKTEKLTDCFFESLRNNGGDQKKAKQAEYDLAWRIDAIKEFNQIYGIQEG